MVVSYVEEFEGREREEYGREGTTEEVVADVKLV